MEFETVSQVFLVGDNRPYNTVLLYPNYDYEQAELAMMSPKERRDFFHSHVVWVNQFLAPYERVVDFTIIPRRFQKEQGELTQKGTFKRKCVVANFRNDIERMYKTDYVTRRLAGREFRIPNWFLREHGFLPDDVIQTQKGITIGAKRAKLHIRADEKNNRRFKLGSFFYRCLANHIDFSEFISRPELWVGNLKLVRFLGVKMFSIEGKTAPAEIEMVDKEIELSKAQEETLSRQFAHSLKQQNPVQAIHKAAFILATEHKALSAKAFKYLDSVLQRQQNNHKASHLIYTILKRKACSHNREIKSAAFQTLLCHTQGDDLKQILELFFKNDCTFLDQKTASQICAVNFGDQHLSTLFSLMTHLQTDASVAHSNEQLRILLNLITEIGIRHPTKYKAIRVELFKWSNIHNQQLASEANACLRQLMLKFREWLGPNQQIAVNPDNAEEFRWRDVITFDENIKPKDCDIIMGALREHPVLQEAIFLFCGRIQIRLQDIAQKGIWISFLGQSTKRARFRVSVHTRYQGSFDFTLTINKEKSTGSLNQELVWMIYVRAKSSYLPLVKDFGGYWPRFNIWTEEYIPGKTIEKFLTRLERRQDPEQRERMRERWLNFAWSGMCAYVDFWNRTERQVEITEPITKNVIIPPEDYQVGYRIVSITKRRRHKNILDLLFRLKAQFLEVVEARYPGLKGRCQWPVIFSAFLEILGEKDGVTLLRAAYKSLSRVKKTPGVKALQLSFERYFRAINETGFLPRRLYFAIKRYHRWHALNPSATQVARI
ncbi:MAG: hypothetical protein ACE5DO_09325, partial [Desulfobacterales bacterium]